MLRQGLKQPQREVLRESKQDRAPLIQQNTVQKFRKSSSQLVNQIRSELYQTNKENSTRVNMFTSNSISNNKLTIQVSSQCPAVPDHRLLRQFDFKIKNVFSYTQQKQSFERMISLQNLNGLACSNELHQPKEPEKNDSLHSADMDFSSLISPTKPEQAEPSDLTSAQKSMQQTKKMFAKNHNKFDSFKNLSRENLFAVSCVSNPAPQPEPKPRQISDSYPLATIKQTKLPWPADPHEFSSTGEKNELARISGRGRDHQIQPFEVCSFTAPSAQPTKTAFRPKKALLISSELIGQKPPEASQHRVSPTFAPLTPNLNQFPTNSFVSIPGDEPNSLELPFQNNKPILKMPKKLRAGELAQRQQLTTLSADRVRGRQACQRSSKSIEAPQKVGFFVPRTPPVKGFLIQKSSKSFEHIEHFDIDKTTKLKKYHRQNLS